MFVSRLTYVTTFETLHSTLRLGFHLYKKDGLTKSGNLLSLQWP